MSSNVIITTRVFLIDDSAYAFVEAIVVTPMGALSVVICAILSHFFLKETLSLFGWLGCGLCIVRPFVSTCSDYVVARLGYQAVDQNQPGLTDVRRGRRRAAQGTKVSCWVAVRHRRSCLSSGRFATHGRATRCEFDRAMQCRTSINRFAAASDV